MSAGFLKRQVRVATGRLSWLAVGLGSLLFTTAALAAPYQGEGFAPVEKDPSKALTAQRTAMLRARADALDAALDELPSPPATALRDRLLKQAGAWTQSYRVLEQKDDGATIRVMVEVEIDVPRLAKAVATASGAGETPAAPSETRPVLASIGGAEGCAPAIAGPLTSALLASGAMLQPGQAGASVRVELRCRLRGRVPYAGVHAAEGVAIVRDDQDQVLVAHNASGFAPADAGALEALVRDLSAGITRALAERQSDRITVVLEGSGPAERVRRLERMLRDSVVGVQSATLTGVAADGAARIGIQSQALTAEQLAARIDGRQLPSGSLHVVTLEPGVVRVRLQP